jgi:transcriptional regulator with GAF, ATPase, and Fis domain
MVPPALRQFILYFDTENSSLVTLLLEHFSPEVKRLSRLDDVISHLSTETCDLFLFVRDLPEGEGDQVSRSDMSLHETVAALERSMITEALLKHHGNISRTARELKLTRRGLQLKLKRLSLKRTCAENAVQDCDLPD